MSVDLFGQSKQNLSYQINTAHNVALARPELQEVRLDDGTSYDKKLVAVDFVIPLYGVEFLTGTWFRKDHNFFNGYRYRVHVGDGSDFHLTLRTKEYNDLDITIEKKYLVAGHVCEVLVQLPQHEMKFYEFQVELYKVSNSISKVLTAQDSLYDWVQLNLTLPCRWEGHNLTLEAEEEVRYGLLYVRLPKDNTTDNRITFYLTDTTKYGHLYYPVDLPIGSQFTPNTTYELRLKLPIDFVTLTVHHEAFTNLIVNGTDFKGSQMVKVIRGSNPSYYVDYKGHKTSLKTIYNISKNEIRNDSLKFGGLVIKANPVFYNSEIINKNETFVVDNDQPVSGVLGRCFVTVTSPGYEKAYRIPIYVPNSKTKILDVRLARRAITFGGLATSFLNRFGFFGGHIYDNYWGFIADFRFSMTAFDSKSKLSSLQETSVLTSEQYAESKKLTPKSLVGNVGGVYRFHDRNKWAVYAAGGYAQFAKMYKFNEEYFTPGIAKGLDIEAGVMFLTGRLVLTLNYSRIMATNGVSDLTFGLGFSTGTKCSYTAKTLRIKDN
ncbi:MAG: hypothetical protein IKQ46_04120 [Bacteroidales bacterium]|nr:hypothetical protein [Bacteroidales bacterium]